tara:strand:+ start:150 stop:338 length:189 start_codon:yes stop_codon:yes gene_type:complete
MFNQLYKHQGNLYKIIRKVPFHNFNSHEQVKEFRDYINSNHVLKTKTHYMFCEVVEDAEIVE